MLTHHNFYRNLEIIKKCSNCNNNLNQDYDFKNYAYKIYEYNPKTKKNRMKYFCSWGCYRKYLKEVQKDYERF